MLRQFQIITNFKDISVPKFYKKIPRQFIKLCKMIDGLEWETEPDYEGIKVIYYII